MRTKTWVFLAFLLAGCSSANELPSGGPYGGGAFDAAGPGGESEGGVVGAVSGTGSGTSIIFVGSGSSASSGVGSSSGSSAGSDGGAAPTWTYLFNTYLSATQTTVGDCDGSCHRHTECSSPSACFAWIGTGAYGALSNGGGLLSWDDGYMPATGPASDPQAEKAFAAWIAAGSQNN